MPYPVALKDTLSSTPEDGLLRQVLAHSDQLMLVRHLMQPGWHGARHNHPHEQLVYVIRGKLIFTLGAESFEIAAGDSLIVPGGVEHQALALEPSEVLDIFTPRRDDYAPQEHRA